MRAIFTIRERVFNGGALVGAIIYTKNEQGELEQKTIDHVKDIENMPLYQLHFTDGTVFNVKENDPVMWEVNSKKKFKIGPVKRLTGRDVWGDQNIDR